MEESLLEGSKEVDFVFLSSRCLFFPNQTGRELPIERDCCCLLAAPKSGRIQFDVSVSSI